MLIAMAGLPGAGKSRLADDLARATGWPVLSVDPVEAAMLYGGVEADQPTGLAAYVAVETIAERLLKLEQTVIIDAVNAAPEARQQWADLATRSGVELCWIEVVCSDPEVHRSRLTGRNRDLLVRLEPDWDDLEPRREQLAAWTAERLQFDSRNDPAANLRDVLAAVQR